MKKRKNKEQWRKIIENCKLSGIPIKKWCTENNISYSTYKYWNTRLNKSDFKEKQWAKIMIPATEEKTAVVESQNRTSININFKDFSVKIEKGFDKETLAELLGVLQLLC